MEATMLQVGPNAVEELARGRSCASGSCETMSIERVPTKTEMDAEDATAILPPPRRFFPRLHTGDPMRTMLKVSMQVEAGNQAIKDGKLPKIMENALQTLRPEAAYFFAENGRRTAMMFFDLKRSEERRVGKECRFRWS